MNGSEVTDRRTVLALDDPEYPSGLRDLSDAPPVLYLQGSTSALVPGVAIIGARKASPAGRRAAAMFGAWCAEAGYTVISGAALGCDSAALDAAVQRNGRTVAVLGCGADVVYPRAAAGLLRDISRSGAVVSELPWGSPPTRWAFPRRNRLIAALSRAVLVLEACVPSGTFSTVDHALDLGREILAVPGSIFSPEAAGPNRLIRQGAVPITEVDDLAAALAPLLGPARPAPGMVPEQMDADPVLRALRATPSRPDDLARALALDIVTIARRVGELERHGVVTRHDDGRYWATG